MMYDFESIIEQLNSNVWAFCFFVPNEISNELLSRKQSRVICTFNGKLLHHCALMPDGGGRYFININKEIRKKLSLNEGDTITVQMEPDNSKYGLPVPVEFEEALALDPEGDKIFHSLTMGKQRNLIHIVGVPKSSEIRIKKSLVILEYLKSVNGKLDFKELNDAFKLANKK